MEEVTKVRLKLIQDSVESLIQSARDAIVKLCENKISAEEVQLISAKLKSNNDRFTTEIYNYYKIMQNPSVEEIEQFTLLQIKADELIVELNIKSQVKPSIIPNTPITIPDNLKITSKLPRMELAKFSGDILKWYQFWDQFASNVDSRNIHEVDKLLYLQSALEGEAKQAIDGLDTTSANYKIAIDTLQKRYGKPGAVIDAHYVALYRINTAGKSVKDCRNVLNEVERHLRVLKSLGEDVNHNHLRVMIMEKFPEDLIYELRMRMQSEDETIDDIRDHLEHIISARETSNRMKKDIDNTDQSGSSIQKDNGKFTLDAFHVRSERKDGKQFKHFRKPFSKDDRKQFQDKRFQNSNQNNYKNNKKRNFNDSKKTECNNSKVKRKKISCMFCEQDHYNDECNTYKSVQERKTKLQNRCYNCFVEGHRSIDCRSKRKCYHCGQFGEHNRALCPKLDFKITADTGSLHVSNNGDTILQTCVVRICRVAKHDKQLGCRILLDCGSQRSYVTSKLAKQLNLPMVEQTYLSIYTFGSEIPREIESPVVSFQIITRTNKRKVILANVVPHITQSVRVPSMAINKIKPYRNLIMADDGSLKDRIDVLLGNDYYYELMSREKIKLEEGLFLINSEFGWILSGKSKLVSKEQGRLTVLTYFQSCTKTESILFEPDLPLHSDSLKVLWDLESIGITDSPKVTREEEAVQNFNETTLYQNSRYQVKWPWIEYPPLLQKIFGLAFGRLTSLVKRLDRDSLISYQKIIKDQLEKGIIEIISDKDSNPDHPVHYLPHHGVFQRDKPIRIVYDASSKLKDGKSLNECLYRGPLMLEDLTGLLLKFREHRVGLIADVEKAFLQIGLQEPDRDVTRFLWLKDLSKDVSRENLVHLRFCRVPFGVVSSPFLLNATIRYHLLKKDHPIHKQIANDIYVDNLVTGSSSVEEALLIYQTSKKSFNDLSMNLREWNSNSKQFQDSIPHESCGKENSIVKVLGLNWNLNEDVLYLRNPFGSSKVHDAQTKREILRVIASIYDPCGFAAPLILAAKVFLQNLWRLKYKWDAILCKELREEWKSIASVLIGVGNVSVSRYYAKNLVGSDSEAKVDQINFELHCFTDASKHAYAAVVYLRSSLGDNNTLNFVIGKSRLVKIEDQDDLRIPRLELLGVLIGSRLLSYVAKTLRIQIDRQILWTDSQVVLSWCGSEKLLPPFIARRVGEIKQNKNLSICFVPTELNPADVATRPTNTINIQKTTWLSGPDFLKQSRCFWPTSSTSKKPMTEQTFFISGEDLSEGSNLLFQPDVHFQNDIVMEVSEPSPSQDDNSASIVDHETQLEHREVQITNEGVNKESCDDYVNRKPIIKQLQKQYFPKEVEGQITNLSKSLRLYIDNDGILRCKGRFHNVVNWEEDEKYPILLPRNTDFSFDIIKGIHQKNYHVGVSHTLALLRRSYWIPRGRSFVQKVIRNCSQCRKYGGGPYKLPDMPPLPVERVKYSPPFTFTGLDYFGPLTVQNEGMIEKCWVCLYTCLAVRAIHMEVVKDLSAEECLLALRRFVSTRGLPHLIISDNALQFRLTSDVLCNKYCIDNHIKWRFIPELAPWCGGFYERLIGLVKHSLKRTIDKHTLSKNQLCTVIKEVEAVVNTRPLTVIGEEFEQVLSPADFLRNGGILLTSVVDKEFLEPATVTKENLIQGWKYGQQMIDEFTKMFVNQYLHSLREKQSSHKQSRVAVNRVPKIGELVQIKGDFSRAHWKVGKISSVIKGSDNQIRVAKVALPTGEILTRSIGHLYPLELNDSDDIKSNNVESSSSSPTNDNLSSNTSPKHTTSISDADAYSEPPKIKTAQAIHLPTHDQTQTSGRPVRTSARKAQDKIKQWTAQLLVIMT